MLLTTTGIVLHTTNYSESSVVSRIFTRQLGVRSYIIKGVRSTRGRHKQNLLQPMCYIDMTVYENQRQQLQHVKELHPSQQWLSIPLDMVKTSIVFFMGEVLYKVLREEEANVSLFDFVVSQLQLLDEVDSQVTGLGSWPVLFLLKLSRFVGIEPMDNYAAGSVLFNLKEGCFLPESTLVDDSMTSQFFLDEASSLALHGYCASLRDPSLEPPLISSEIRARLLKDLVEYYKVHFPNFRSLKSYEVLHAILR